MDGQRRAPLGFDGHSKSAHTAMTRKPVCVPGCFVRMYRADRQTKPH